MSHFDTYDFIKNLEKSGLPESQAKAICDGLKECHDTSDHVSKADMICLESRLEKKYLIPFIVKQKSLVR